MEYRNEYVGNNTTHHKYLNIGYNAHQVDIVRCPNIVRAWYKFHRDHEYILDHIRILVHNDRRNLVDHILVRDLTCIQNV